MTKFEAVKELLWEEGNIRRSRTSFRRVTKACQTLGLDVQETNHILTRNGYKSPTTGEVYEKFQEKK